ncbi:MAG: hypothetical protein HY821_26045 [Acidobacteria bacterium]|nr:hypothetical protein [Acidobacteriota bacterium]
MTRFFSALFVCLLAAPAQERFPKPNPSQAFHELKVLDERGQAVRTPQEDWDRARRILKEDSSWSTWLTARRAETDEWMANRRDRVEWVAGWWHDFVNDKDGAFLTWTP